LVSVFERTNDWPITRRVAKITPSITQPQIKSKSAALKKVAAAWEKVIAVWEKVIVAWKKVAGGWKR
jgi:hypothetical protein